MTWRLVNDDRTFPLINKSVQHILLMLQHYHYVRAGQVKLKKCSGFLSDCPSGFSPRVRLSRLSTTNTDVVFPSAMAISYPPGEIQGEDKVWQTKSNCALPREKWECLATYREHIITSNKRQTGLVCVYVCVCVCKDTAKIQLWAHPVHCTGEQMSVCV